ncbi:unnamed protein product [Gadus morhua 'NCC']
MQQSDGKSSGGGGLDGCLLHHRTEAAGGTCIGDRMVKVESGVLLSSSQTAELAFLRSRVRDLEREKAEMGAENQRLRTMLVNEIPGLLSTMWQTLGQNNTSSHHHHSPLSVSMTTGRGGARDYGSSYSQHHPLQPASHTSEDGEFSPSDHLDDHSTLGPEDLSGDMVDYGEEEEEPICSQTDMVEAELRRRGAESQCANRHASSHASSHANSHASSHANSHIHHVEVYPGSGVMCDVRSWHAANQAQSPTAMARTLLLGVFDMETLISSNLRGGRSRRPAFHPQRSALDPHRINAIFNATLARFPQARKGVIGTGINSKLSEIRFRFRKANPVFVIPGPSAVSKCCPWSSERSSLPGALEPEHGLDSEAEGRLVGDKMREGRPKGRKEFRPGGVRWQDLRVVVQRNPARLQFTQQNQDLDLETVQTPPSRSTGATTSRSAASHDLTLS